MQEKLKYSGFGESLAGQLEKAVKAKKEEFTLDMVKDLKGQQMEYQLRFNRSAEGKYYYNGFDAKLSGANGSEVSQRFYQNQGISAKEAYNLLEGRAVFKSLFNREGERYNAWLQLDLGKRDDKGQHPVSQYHQNYGFKLEQSVGQLAIAGFNSPEIRDTLLYSLKKGNLHEVGLDGREGSYYLAANPRYKSVAVYDESGKRLKNEQLERRMEVSDQPRESQSNARQKKVGG